MIKWIVWIWLTNCLSHMYLGKKKLGMFQETQPAFHVLHSFECFYFFTEMNGSVVVQFFTLSRLSVRNGRLTIVVVLKLCLMKGNWSGQQKTRMFMRRCDMKKSGEKKHCRVCTSKEKKRKDTIYYCPGCHGEPGSCSLMHFKELHTKSDNNPQPGPSETQPKKKKNLGIPNQRMIYNLGQVGHRQRRKKSQ